MRSALAVNLADRHELAAWRAGPPPVRIQKWVTSPSAVTGTEPIVLEWLLLTPGDDMERVFRRRRPPDVLLGGPLPSLDRLARAERLLPLSASGLARYCVSRRTDNGPADLGDPRTDVRSLAWAKRQLESGRWSEGYARLVDIAGHSPRIGRHTGLEQGVRREHGIVVSPSDPLLAEGVGVLATSRDPALAKEFVRFLLETDQAELARPSGATDGASDSDFELLLADLLGATLVDAQDELWAAWKVLERAGSPDRRTSG